MLKADQNDDWARVCDTCHSAACTVYCRADSAYLCTSCDAQIHTANHMASRHERVWVCQSCERAPAAFLCKADAASLCSACDSEIHSANPLARRHQRIPIPPMTDHDDHDDDDEAASWLLFNPAKNNNGLLFVEEGDEYLDLVECNSSMESQFTDEYNQYQIQECNGHLHHQLGISYGSHSYNGSMNNSVSMSSMDISIVPESTTNDMNVVLQSTTLDVQNDQNDPPIQVMPQLSPMDREARVLRYREKKKTRKFVKTIRYASRKAYAETRPRIKGRFAKRTEIEAEVDQVFTTTLIQDTVYGIVPSF